jgi:Domain of unknown function (DUF1707)/Cell wall-active antibiotics response 4TMS YvqF
MSGVVRASDQDRDGVVEELKLHAVAGRLTLAELAERVERAYSAATRTELDALTRDLPSIAEAPAPPRKRRRLAAFALVGDVTRRGRWRPAEASTAVALLGDVHLDLTEAEVEREELAITAVAAVGDVVIVIPAGVEVELGALALLGDVEQGAGEATVPPGAPRVRVRGAALVGDIRIERAPERRALGA